MKEVETLIPHRDPFLFIDKIVSATPEEIVGIKIFPDNDQFLKGVSLNLILWLVLS